jgi:TonB family protein
MRSAIILTFSLTLPIINSHAQKIFYDKDNKVATPENGYYYVVKKQHYAEGDTVREYYCSTNSLKLIKIVNSAGITNGMCMSYYENGTVKVKGQYGQYRPVGKFTKWYSNGQIKMEQAFGAEDEPDQILNYWDSLGTQLVKDGDGYCDCVLDIIGFSESRERGKVEDGLRDSVWTGYRKSGEKYFDELYQMGKLIDGVSYDSVGRDYSYKEIQQMAKPLNGMEFFYQQIARNIKYPAKARRHGIEGKVFVEFILQKDGAITNVKTIKGIGGGCDEAAEEVIRLSPKWTPGRQRGQLVRQKMVLPINFKLG